jgi:hypothetical protein
MATHHALPWEDDSEWAHFDAAAEQVRDTFEHGVQADTGVSSATVDGLRWRHWLVAFCVRHAAEFSSEPLSLVECGVGDGLSAYFACNEADHLRREYRFHAYDAWAEVATNHGVDSYRRLAVDRTRRNLKRFEVEYHVGYLPETFDQSAPGSVHYLSIDLNAVEPTRAALEFFVPRLAPRAVVLFDDYGHARFEDQRRFIDEYCSLRPGALLKQPTGQAIWFT